MHFQLISIFPEFFDILQLSLLGKAAKNGVLSWRVTDLRDYTDDPHRTVDDTPYGGGAGMVMRADIWGKAVDAALNECGFTPEAASYEAATGSFDLETADNSQVSAKTILAIPTPSGHPLTQVKVRELAAAENIIVACGRYEGIDARVAEYYRGMPGLEVMEFSLGDYVLNGGEIAAVALVESVGRLLDGMVGNPESLVEESFEGSGLLEYPAFTRPPCWRGLKVPAVLQGGNHAEIEEWRRGKSLEKTAKMRPELFPELEASKFSKQERETLARLGWVYLPDKATGKYVAKKVTIRQPRRGEALALSALGSETFPLACPSSVTPAEIAEFTETEFDLETVKARLEDPQKHRYLVAEIEGELVGYTYMIVGLDETQAAEAGITPGDAYLSKCYVREAFHGLGLSGALLEDTLANLEPGNAVSLGTSIYNKWAQKFYRRHHFQKTGTRKFRISGRLFQDIVFRRVLGNEDSNS